MKNPLDFFSGMIFGISPQTAMLAATRHTSDGTALVASGGQGNIMESHEMKTTFHAGGTIVSETKTVRSITFPFSARFC